jgi:glutathione S-transferase
MYSGAIIQYLIDQYDTSEHISYRTPPEKYHCQQWLAFQISGQGPYFGQATWFARFHHEKIPSAIDRYVAEMLSVIGVLEVGLERNGTGWLVGDKTTYADLSFRTWAAIGKGLLGELGKLEGFVERFPKYTEWLKRMDGLEAVGQIQERMKKGTEEHGLQ